jgi:hypothetical protein
MSTLGQRPIIVADVHTNFNLPRSANQFPTTGSLVHSMRMLPVHVGR